MSHCHDGTKLQTELVIFLRHVYHSIFSFDSLIYIILCKLVIGNTIWLFENFEVDFDILMHVNNVCLNVLAKKLDTKAYRQRKRVQMFPFLSRWTRSPFKFLANQNTPFISFTVRSTLN